MKMEHNDEPSFTGGTRTINTTIMDVTRSTESLERNKLDKTGDISFKTANTSFETQKRPNYTIKMNKSFSPYCSTDQLQMDRSKTQNHLQPHLQSPQTPIFDSSTIRTNSTFTSATMNKIPQNDQLLVMKKSFEGGVRESMNKEVERDAGLEFAMTSAMKNRMSAQVFSSKQQKTTHKIILLGDSDVGKTAIFTRLTQNRFLPGKVSPTISMDIGRRVFCIRTEQQRNYLDNGQENSCPNTAQSEPDRYLNSESNQTAMNEVNLQLWDTPGQEMYRSLVSIYYRNVQGVVLVVSLEDSPSTGRVQQQLKGLNYWMEELNNSSEINEKLSFIILGNKADLADPNNCPCDEFIQHWCKQQTYSYNIQIRYFKTSAKTGHGIEEAFKSLSKTILEKSGNESTDFTGMKLTRHSHRLSSVLSTDAMSDTPRKNGSRASGYNSPTSHRITKNCRGKKCSC